MKRLFRALILAVALTALSYLLALSSGPLTVNWAEVGMRFGLFLAAIGIGYLLRGKSLTRKF